MPVTLRHPRMQLKPLPSPAFLNGAQENRLSISSGLPGQISDVAKLQNPSSLAAESYSSVNESAEYMDETKFVDSKLHGRLASIMSNDDRRTSSVHSDTSQQSTFGPAGTRRPSLESLPEAERTESLSSKVAKFTGGNLPDFSASQFLFDVRTDHSHVSL